MMNYKGKKHMGYSKDYGFVKESKGGLVANVRKAAMTKMRKRKIRSPFLR